MQLFVFTGCEHSALNHESGVLEGELRPSSGRITGVQGYNPETLEYTKEFAFAGQYVVLYGSFQTSEKSKYTSSFGTVEYESASQINIKLPKDFHGLHSFQLANDKGSTNLVSFRVVSPPDNENTNLDCLVVTPNGFHFGTVRLGCHSATQQFEIFNLCPDSLKISSVEVVSGAGQQPGAPNCVGPEACPEFSIENSPRSITLSANASNALPFSVKYRPLDVGNDLGKIRVLATYGDELVYYDIAVSGKGDRTGVMKDTFAISTHPATDVLIVMDNSASMYVRQEKIADAASSFLEYAQSVGADYRIGVISTDNEEYPGHLWSDRSHPEKWLTPSSENVAEKIKSRFKLGTSGSGFEMCFEPAIKALTSPLANNENAGFLREEAALSILCVSEELEQSPRSVSYYFKRFLDVKGSNRANQFSLSALASFSSVPDCFGVLDDGRYAEMVSSSKGFKADICTNDLTQPMQQLGKRVFGFRTDYFLNSTPNVTGANSIQVDVDGVNIPSGNGTQAAWTYDPLSNSVNFEPSSAPMPGQTVNISYDTSCL